MSEITVTMPKSEYDELVEFKNKISEKKHTYRIFERFNSGYYSGETTSFITNDECIEEIERKHTWEQKRIGKNDFRYLQWYFHIQGGRNN